LVRLAVGVGEGAVRAHEGGGDPAAAVDVQVGADALDAAVGVAAGGDPDDVLRDGGGGVHGGFLLVRSDQLHTEYAYSVCVVTSFCELGTRVARPPPVEGRGPW